MRKMFLKGVAAAWTALAGLAGARAANVTVGVAEGETTPLRTAGGTTRRP